MQVERIKKRIIIKNVEVFSGDSVKVIHPGETYSSYVQMADKFQLLYWLRNYQCPRNAIGIYIQHAHDNYHVKICHVRFKTEYLLSFDNKHNYSYNYSFNRLKTHEWEYVDYIIGYRGLKAEKQALIYLDDELFKINI